MRGEMRKKCARIMLKNEREQEILNILKVSGFVTVKILSERLFTSESSVRRDLGVLEKKGFVKRSYGGAELLQKTTNVLPFFTRAYTDVEQKSSIAKKAVELIKDGSIVFLDQSSTSFFLAQEISKRQGITIVTNNTEILNYLSDTSLCVHSSGGILSSVNRNCLIGQNAQRTFEGIYADIVFFSSKALSDNGVISDSTQEEVFVRNSMLANADKKVFLCSSSKFGNHSAYKQCTLNDVDYLISEDDSSLAKIKYSNFVEII